MGYAATLLLAFIGLALAPPPLAAAEQELKASHGKTWINMPDPILRVRVDAEGKIASVTKTTLQVRHEDRGDFCRKVEYVWARWVHPGAAAQGVCPVGHVPNTSCLQHLMLCTFNYNDATFNVDAGDVTRAQTLLAPLCQGPERTKGWTGRVPFYRLQVFLDYSTYLGSHSDLLVDADQQIELTCDPVPCQPLQLSNLENNQYNQIPTAHINTPYEHQVFTGGRNVVVTPTNIPPGMTLDQSGKLRGVVPPYAGGRYKLSFQVQDNCPWRSAKRVGTATLKVTDDLPPQVSQVTQSTAMLPQQGGDLVVTVKASDNTGISNVILVEVKDMQHVILGSASMTSGSPTDGEWRYTWRVPGNSKTTPQRHVFYLKVQDVDENETRFAGFTTSLFVDVAAADTAPPQLAAVTLTPTALPHQGGDVTLSVRASDNTGVVRVLVTQVRPDGQQTNGIVPLASGTPTNGEWRVSWRVAGSSGSTPEIYTVAVKVHDAAGNHVDGQPIPVTVAGRSAGSSPQVAGQGSPGARPQPARPPYPVPQGAARVEGATGTPGSQGAQSPTAQGSQVQGSAAAPAGPPQTAGWWVRGTSAQDAALVQAIQGRLQQQSNGPWGRVAGSVGVQVANGAVRLTGKLSSPQHREAIEMLVRGTQGVRSVTNAIAIGQ